MVGFASLFIQIYVWFWITIHYRMVEEVFEEAGRVQTLWIAKREEMGWRQQDVMDEYKQFVKTSSPATFGNPRLKGGCGVDRMINRLVC